MVARGHDLWTGADGRARVVAEARLQAEVALKDRTVTTIDAGPSLISLDGLVGRRASSGFRRAIDDLFVEEERAASLLYQLLDDLPTAFLVSGYALVAAGISPPTDALQLNTRADICAGWVSGGTILAGTEHLGHVPHTTGPPAPPLDSEDLLAWHQLDPMSPHAMQRRRRIDVWPIDDAALAVEAFFRDTHVDADGRETVVHEYLVVAEIERGTLAFRECRADIGVLPWFECPSAAASASRLIGTEAHDLRARIRETFTGVSTCTHLNDTLRALAALPFLAVLLDSTPA
jgi:Protein of unknown function (DUF2889)